jgi:hypothetical protein
MGVTAGVKFTMPLTIRKCSNPSILSIAACHGFQQSWSATKSRLGMPDGYQFNIGQLLQLLLLPAGMHLLHSQTKL